MKKLIIGGLITSLILISGLFSQTVLASDEIIIETNLSNVSQSAANLTEPTAQQSQSITPEADETDQIEQIEEALDLETPESEADEPESEVGPVLDLAALKIIKFQLRDSGLKGKERSANQFLVLINLGQKAINLDDLKINLFNQKDHASILSKTYLLKSHVLLPGQKLALINNYDLLEKAGYLIGQKDLVIDCLTEKCNAKTNWFPTTGEHKIEITQNDQVIDSLEYSNKLSDGYQLVKHDILVQAVDEAGQLKFQADQKPIFNSFMARDSANQVWLKLGQLAGPVETTLIDAEPAPVLPSVEPPLPILICKADQDLVNGKCLKKCKIGEARNPDTNRCQKIKTDPPIKTCPAGSYLNPLTNRCLKYSVVKTISPCPEGQYRHPETGRCRKINQTPECKTGYELGFTNTCLKKCKIGEARNPDTNRCQKQSACPTGFSQNLEGGCDEIIKSSEPIFDTAVAVDPNDFNWSSFFNSPISGVVVTSAVFIIYNLITKRN